MGSRVVALRTPRDRSDDGRWAGQACANNRPTNTYTIMYRYVKWLILITKVYPYYHC
jgi:hypothetical protein